VPRFCEGKSEKRLGRKPLGSGLKNLAARSAGDRQEAQHSLQAFRGILPNALPVSTARTQQETQIQTGRYKEIETRNFRLHNSRRLFTDLM
jgi:hypothetical protein